MSTRAHIVKKIGDNKYIGVYHHSDGYVKGLGKLLLDHYNNEEQLDKLIALGDLSYAGPIPEDDPKLWKVHYDFKTGKVDYESDKCRTYRGRGDENYSARVGTLKNFTTEDYTYVWVDDHYEVYNWSKYLGRLDDILARMQNNQLV